MNNRSDAPLSLGFIGGAINSAVGHVHASAAVMDHRWRLDAGCFSRDKEINQQTAKSYGVSEARTHADWRILLEREKGRLDAISVLTPITDHAEMVSACLAAGFPVICEKPLTTSSREVEKILLLRDQSQGFLAITYNYSGYPMLRELRDLIRRGVLGKLIHFQAEMPQEGFIRTDPRGNKPQPQAWRLRDGPIPTLHLDLAAHLHQLLWYLTGCSPLAVAAQQSSHGWFPQVVDNASALCRYSSDLQGNLWFSKSALGHRNGLRLRLYGTEASAEWFQAEPEDLLLNFVDGRREIRDRASVVTIANQPRYTRFKAGHPAGFIEAFANLYSDIGDCLADFRQTGSFHSDEVFSAELALEGCRLLEALNQSARQGLWQEVVS